ncbi:MAG: type II secretion system protein GspD [Verrucomicrobia bacterium]|nr:type II secretion system protein GspD [Verrucomicrobiota bacterium]
MKSKLILLSLAGLLAGSTVGWTQDKPAATPTNAAPHDPNEVIPLIVMDDVGLIDAIKNLARQANLNYILDPKVSFGTVGPDGKVIPQPTISIRWEKLTAQQALTAVLNNYNLIIVEDPKTQIARITVKDPALPDPLISKIIQLKFASPTNIESVVRANLIDKRSKVIGDVRTSQLVVLATEKEMLGVDELVERLDTPTKQVLIEAKLVETSSNPKTKKGIDWTSTLQAQNLSLGNNAQRSAAPNQPSTPGSGGPGTISPAPIGGLLQDPSKFIVSTSGGLTPYTAFLNADGVKTVLSFLNSDADAQVLSTPRAVTLDNQEAILSVTRAEPIFATTAGTQGSPGGSQVTYTNLGTILKVTPRISANDFVNLKVIPEVSSVFNTITKTVAGTINQADEYDIRRIETQVLIPSGNTLVMGGLVKNNSNKTYTKVPVFGDIPVLGWAFRSESKTREKNNLMIFITPTIVTEDDYQVTARTDFLKSTFVEEPELKPTAWDSAKPLDWSKPIPGDRAIEHEQNLKN